jgi:hypothetical protein
MPSAQQHDSPPANEQSRPAVASVRGKTQRDQVLRDQAWIGDAVLALYARLKILREDGTLDGERAVRMSSNQFLAAFGEPTAVEAAIGRVFEREGLDAAFAHIERVIMPLFGKQEEKRQRKSGNSGKAPH